MRADARRNLDVLLRSALDVFARSGVDAPVREIAEEAGVGMGTLYRHFPKRTDLIVAVVQKEVDACAEAAIALLAEHPPATALTRWVRRYVEFIDAKIGLASTLHSGDPAYDDLHAYFESRLCPALQGLLDAAAASGDVRPDVDPGDLLFAIARLCACRDDDPARSRRVITLLLDGVRHGGPRTEPCARDPAEAEIGPT